MPKPRKFGTSTRRTWDTRRLGKALGQPGIDTRHWVSYGTVASVGDSGEPDVTSTKAIYNGPEGVEVDVVLEPLGIPVTCHYTGLQGGCSATIQTPIRPGDRVIVVMPEGDVMGPPVIVAILHSATCPVPVGPDNKPIFRNDRVLVWAEDTDIDIRAGNNVRVQIKQDGTILLGDGADQKIIKGSDYRAAENALLFGSAPASIPVGPFPPAPPLPTSLGQGLLAAFEYLENVAVGPLAPLRPGFFIAKTALQQFQQAASSADDFLSDVSKTK